MSPVSRNPNLNFDLARYFLSAYATMRTKSSADFSRPEFPRTGSFFPWAVTDNGDTFVWIVDGHPDEWTVAIHSKDQSEEEMYRLSATGLLVSLLLKTVTSQILPTSFPSSGNSRQMFKAAEKAAAAGLGRPWK